MFKTLEKNNQGSQIYLNSQNVFKNIEKQYKYNDDKVISQKIKF